MFLFFFLLITCREQLVTPDELEQSKKVLHNMLLEYVDNEKNSINLLNREKSLKMLNRIIGSAEAPTAPDLKSIKGLEDEIMNKVIQNYETESKGNLMKGLLFGNLMTVMLIQIQKMKMHMEAALLSMDKVLTSNELTMAATAAIPGVALSWLAGYSFYLMFIKTKAPKNKSSEQLQLRLAFGDIERAINSLICQVKKSGMDFFESSTSPRKCLDSEECSNIPSLEKQAPSGDHGQDEDDNVGPKTETETGGCELEEQEQEQEEKEELQEGRGISNLSRDELLVLRYNGLVIFQVA